MQREVDKHSVEFKELKERVASLFRNQMKGSSELQEDCQKPTPIPLDSMPGWFLARRDVQPGMYRHERNLCHTSPVHAMHVFTTFHCRHEVMSGMKKPVCLTLLN